jgi:hypothetical protein
VAMALPPFPNKPPRKPIAIPITNAPKCCNCLPFGLGGGFTFQGILRKK